MTRPLITALRPNEQMVRLFRRHGALYAPWVLLGLAIIFGGAWYVAWFYEHPPWGLFILLSLVIIGALLSLKAFLEWRYSTVLLTTERLIIVDQRGLWERHVSEIGFDHIIDIGYHIRGFSQVIVGYGTIEIRSSSVNGLLRYSQMPAPRAIRETIVDAWQRYRELHPSQRLVASAEEAREMLRELKEKFGSQLVREALEETSVLDNQQ